MLLRDEKDDSVYEFPHHRGIWLEIKLLRDKLWRESNMDINKSEKVIVGASLEDDSGDMIYYLISGSRCLNISGRIQVMIQRNLDKKAKRMYGRMYYRHVQKMRPKTKTK